MDMAYNIMQKNVFLKLLSYFNMFFTISNPSVDGAQRIKVTTNNI